MVGCRFGFAGLGPAHSATGLFGRRLSIQFVAVTFYQYIASYHVQNFLDNDFMVFLFRGGVQYMVAFSSNCR